MLDRDFPRQEICVMKAEIHPKYEDVKVRCACGETFVTRSKSARNATRSSPASRS
jgi:predicted RNA-binding Zn-ribbon protein involved in translation (DUF1610 family)